MAVACVAGTAASAPIDDAVRHMYNSDFGKAQQTLSGYIAGNPRDPLGYAMRAAAYLFGELDRLMILDGEFFADDKKIADKKHLRADPNVRRLFYEAVGEAEKSAKAVLAGNPTDANALFALAVSGGVTTDYMALVEKRQLGSLSVAKQTHGWAIKLLAADPQYYDAYLTTGLNEYLVGSLPFFVKWFVKFDQTQGDKTVAVKQLEMVAKSGRYLGPFARVLLAIINLREKHPEQARVLLAGLVREYPGSRLFREQLDKLSLKMK